MHTSIVPAVTCPPVSLENGEVHYDNLPMDGNYGINTRAFISCNDAFKRNGPLFSICQNSGTWEPEIATCEEGIKCVHLAGTPVNQNIS